MGNKYKTKIEKNNEILEKTRKLQEKIKKELSIRIPTYIIDEIITGGRKENVIALINLARENGRITKYEAKLFIRNLDKYMAN